ncbi:MAG TPA: ABC transporter permease [Candidatus Dormibacteraeota bacterium]|jgi:putative ABC transport system permease protein|nr:ABC transporter permease [Candidatus Dormibacteraeota bacterium]
MSTLFNKLRSAALRFANPFRKQKLDYDLSNELESHLQLHIEDNLRSGMSPAEARRDALLKLGGHQQTKEAFRDRASFSVLENLFRDFRFAIRQLRKNLGFTSVAVLTLTLGIGANTAIFSVVYATLVAPLPYPHPEQLVMLWSNFQNSRGSVSVGDYLDWKNQSTSFQDMTALTGGGFNLSISGRPEIFPARIVSPNFFRMQGIPLAQGRDFFQDEDRPGNDHVLIMTNAIWQDRFGSDPHIVGKQLRLNGELYTVVGVLAKGMPDRFESHLFLPLAFKPEDINRTSHQLFIIGRLKPGVSVQQANSELLGIARHLAETFPTSNKGWDASVTPLHNAFTSPNTIKNLWLLLAAVGLLLLIACVNVANLLLTRGSARQKEIALRAAMGASRNRLVSQFFVESLLLALIGGIFGVALGWVALKFVLVVLPQYSVPTEADIRLNLPVLFFSLVVTFLVGILCGCLPAFQGSHWGLMQTLKDASRSVSTSGQKGLRNVLVVFEFAIALTLLTAAGLVIHSSWKLTRLELGFQREHLLTFSLPVREERFSSAEQISLFYRQVLERLRAVPGASSVSVGTGLPVAGTSITRFNVYGQSTGDPSARPATAYTAITPEYFQTLGITMESGRSFTEEDSATGVPVAVVNQMFAKQYLSGLDPFAQRLVVDRPIPGRRTGGPQATLQIVGVSRDTRNGGIRENNIPEVYVPFWQSPWLASNVIVRTDRDISGMATSLAAAIQPLDPDLPLNRLRTMDQIVDESLAGDRFATILFAAFATVALFLAAVGIYGVMSFTITQQTHDIGLRMALGSPRNRVLLHVIRQGMTLSLFGLLLGLVGAYFVGLAMHSVLYEISSVDPAAISGVAAILLITGALACYIPARRASKVDPMVALRYE